MFSCTYGFTALVSNVFIKKQSLIERVMMDSQKFPRNSGVNANEVAPVGPIY